MKYVIRCATDVATTQRLTELELIEHNDIVEVDCEGEDLKFDFALPCKIIVHAGVVEIGGLNTVFLKGKGRVEAHDEVLCYCDDGVVFAYDKARIYCSKGSSRVYLFSEKAKLKTY